MRVGYSSPRTNTPLPVVWVHPVSIEDALLLVDRLERRELIDVIQRDQLGNHVIRLTGRGERYVGM